MAGWFDDLVAGDWLYDESEKSTSSRKKQKAEIGENWPIFEDLDQVLTAARAGGRKGSKYTQEHGRPIRAWIRDRFDGSLEAVKVYPSGRYRSNRLNE